MGSKSGNKGAWWTVAYRLKEYIRPERMIVFGSLCALLIATGMRLLKPLPLAFVVDYVLLDVVDVAKDGVKNPPNGIVATLLSSLDTTHLLFGCAAAVILIALFMAGSSYLSTVGLALAGSRILSRVRNDLFAHMQRLSLRFHSQARTGDLTMRLINDIGMLREAVITALMPMLANILILVGMFSMMIYINWQLSAVTLLAIPIIWWSTVRSSKRIHEVSRAQRKREGALAAKAAEFIGSIRTVQSLSLESETMRSFVGDDLESRKQNVQSKKLSAGLERRVDLIVAFVSAAVLLKGAYSVLAGQMTPGDLIIFMSYLNNAFRPVREYAKYTGRLSKALAAGERVVNLLDEQPDIQDKPNAPELSDVKGQVSFEHVSFTYNGKDSESLAVLRDMDFKIKAGESVAIVGPSGAGKSTITSLLLRLYDINKGRICIDGKDIRDYKISSVRGQIAIVPQDNLLFGLTVRENIALGAVNRADISDEEIIEAAKLAQAHNFISALPEGYDTVLSERGGSLSGGQRQRIAIARAAINKSAILILDEPTVGLDQESETQVISALENLMKGRTTIMITHDLALAARTDRILFVDRGVIVEQGNHQQLLEKAGNYATWWKMQLG
ncbi:ABC transporter ATP-binding protein [Pasteurella dagmatis]|uniref:ABC transporter, ATP-binding protein n=1 Tax=Pasteurella dagmatis ATCC 43325 TaxID=667128 RepID=C9PS77_9PAST|nr:ABC transporter ATP-binding protein [Pasteurella dagmatis]EEX49804.1 ABC transporter, ATP-binding protein [Pasteurella dagmatis ATCC 43325]SNV71568.1 lipid A export ATP-binding/permease protein MsbA [Pasteurella dagmatis]